MSKETRTNLLRITGLVLVIGLSALIYAFRDQARQLALLGYPGIFLVALLSNASIIFPAPGAAIVFAMGGIGIFHPLGIGLAAGTGGAIGEMTGYIAGVSGQVVVERMDIYERIAPYVKKFDIWAIFVLAAVPNPFFDLAGVAAGVLKIPVRRFFPAVWAGQIIRMLIYAYAGSLSLGWFAQ